MSRFTHLRDQGYARLTESPSAFRDVGGDAKADGAPRPRRAPAGDGSGWAGTLSYVGAIVGAVVVGLAAPGGRAEKKFFALVGGLAGMIVGGLMGLVLDSCE